MAFYTILYSFWTILCVSHELSFHFPWASCGKRPVSNEQSFSFLWASCGVISGEFALWEKLRGAGTGGPVGKACTAGAVLGQLAEIDPSGQIRGDPSLDGPLTALAVDDVVEQSSRTKKFTEGSDGPARMMYAAPRRRTTNRPVVLDVPVPTWMRAPGRCAGMFGIEVAMDELVAGRRHGPPLRHHREP